MRRRVVLLTAVPVWLLAGQAALGSPEVAEELRACAGIAASAERLACYDRLAGVAADAAGSLVSRGIPAAGERAGAAVGEPGRASVDKPIAAPAPPPFGAAAGLQPAVIETRLDGLHRTARGLHRFTLENRQVWLEVTPGRGGFRTGVPVRIEPTAMGSFVLVDDVGRSTRVRRVE